MTADNGTVTKVAALLADWHALLAAGLPLSSPVLKFADVAHRRAAAALELQDAGAHRGADVACRREHRFGVEAVRATGDHTLVPDRGTYADP